VFIGAPLENEPSRGQAAGELCLFWQPVDDR